MTRDPATGTRRAPVPPLPLPHELLRGPLVTLLGRRFDVAVTTVVAGAGFGKTTALSQAIRSNDLAPRGIDLWVSCEPGDEEATRLASAIVGATVERGRGPVGSLLAALGRLAPNDVCVIVDDVHLLPDGCSSQAMLGELIERLPPHAHVVLSGRELPSVPLARLRASGRVLDIAEADLGFTSTEVTALARLHGRDDPTGTDLAGWPSLVQLALSARGAAPSRFLWEEVVAELPAELRAGLLTLATLGWGSAADVARIAGRRVDCEALADRVPLVRRDERGGYLVHHLWEDATDRIFAGAELDEVRGRALALFAERHETFRFGAAAFAWGDVAAQRRAALTLVNDTLGSLPVQTAQRWIAEARPEIADAPELRLLDAAVRHACGDRSPGLDRGLTDLADELTAAAESRAVALALSAIVAFSRGDQSRLFEVSTIAASTPGADEVPMLRFLIGAAEAAFASLTGDVDAAISILDNLGYDEVPERTTELVYRLRATMLMLAGRSDDAEPFAPVLERSYDRHVRWLPTFLRWQSTQPWVAVDLDVDGDPTAAPIDETNDRDRYIHAAHFAFIGAARGDLATTRRLRPMVDAMRARREVRDATIGVLSAAACRIAEHDEPAAAAIVVEHLRRFPLSDPLGALHLRRHLAIGYVLDREVRAHLDSIELGKLHAATRDAAAALVAARDGRLEATSALPDAATAVTSFPLAWTVELAVRARTVGHADADHVIGEVAAHYRDAVDAELRRWTDSRTAAYVRAASDLLEVTRLQPTTRIEVLGPLRVTCGDTVSDSPDLRRGRVRALLELLVLRAPIERDRVLELMWPDADPDSARQNLRATLARLRKAVGESDGASRSPIDADRDRIALGPRHLVELDLAEFRHHVATAERCRTTGDSVGVIEALASAVDLWRGDPFEDLTSVPGLEPDIEHVRRDLVDAAVQLGEVLIVAGRFDEVLDSVERCAAAAPYDERVHRLAIAAHMHRHDRRGLEGAVTRARTALAELGVDPEPATQMLLRRADDVVRSGAACSRDLR